MPHVPGEDRELKAGSDVHAFLQVDEARVATISSQLYVNIAVGVTARLCRGVNEDAVLLVSRLLHLHEILDARGVMIWALLELIAA